VFELKNVIALRAVIGSSVAMLLALPLSASAATAPAVDFATSNTPGKTAVLSTGAKGPAVLRAQILLDRARFSPGEIDAAYGSNLQHAIAGFQASKGLPANGTVDAATWAALDADAAPALVAYTVTAADAAGPYVTIPTDMMEKSKLPALGYTSALEALGERFHSSPKLLQRLNPGKDFARAGEVLLVPSVEPATPIPAVARLVIDKSERTLSLLDATDHVVAQYPASTGSEHDPLPIGDWKIQGIAKSPVFHYNPELFWDANPEHGKATIPAGPNNPVGVVWMDLSKEHYGIHGSPEPSSIGKTESHGCIRLTNWSALEVAAAIKPGLPALLKD
jgi:lipoprotein-anchoring transpeptidase ErfK/SrfK